jgi:hypothetical protein
MKEIHGYFDLPIIFQKGKKNEEMYESWIRQKISHVFIHSFSHSVSTKTKNMTLVSNQFTSPLSRALHSTSSPFPSTPPYANPNGFSPVCSFPPTGACLSAFSSAFRLSVFPAPTSIASP